jgi:transposase
MILLAADGMPNAEIARVTGVSRPTVIAWRERYEAGGIPALGDSPRSGRPAEISEADVVVATLADDGRPPARLEITHWSARFLAAELGISFATVARIWRKWAIQPHRLETFKFSTDPELEAKIPRHRRPVPCSPGRRGGGQRGREIPGAGRRRVRCHGPARGAIRRGTCTSVQDLTGAIGAFIDACNDRCEPFSWTKDADDLLTEIRL